MGMRDVTHAHQTNETQLNKSGIIEVRAKSEESAVMNRVLISLGCIISVLSAAGAHAFAPTTDLLKIKGYSPQTVDVIYTQTKRMEWKNPPAPTMTPEERFYHNVIINDWTGNFDAFGSRIIRERQ